MLFYRFAVILLKYEKTISQKAPSFFQPNRKIMLSFKYDSHPSGGFFKRLSEIRILARNCRDTKLVIFSGVHIIFATMLSKY